MVKVIKHPDELKSSLKSSTRYELHRAINYVDGVVNLVESMGDIKSINQDYKTYRSRIGSKTIKTYTEQNHVDYSVLPLPIEEISSPPKDKVLQGRFNSTNKPALYLSTSPEVALAECRAIYNEYCTVGEFKLKSELSVATFLRDTVEFSIFDDDPKNDESGRKIGKENVFNQHRLVDLTEFLSRRVKGVERDLHYRACNLIASAFADKGFDGIVYKTSFWSPKWNDSRISNINNQIKNSNIVLFNTESVRAVSTTLYNINWNRPVAEKVE